MTHGYFPKLIELDDLSPNSEPTIQIVRPGEYNRLGHVKTASEALDYIKQVKPIPGKTIILVLAMTAGEFYGPNRNGDGWPERPLIAGNTKIGPNEVLPMHHKSFETNANIFKHHINKDPEKRIGDVLKSFYNWPMHRVELLLSLDNKKAEDVVERIENEEFLAVSMGCFRSGNLVTMGDGTRKPIEEIVRGDIVLTHEGRARRVTEAHVRLYTGDMYTLKPAAGPEIVCTHEHPFLTETLDNLKPKNDKSSYRTWDKNAICSPEWVHAACLDDHLLMSPIIQETSTPSYVTKEFAQLFGAYVADGSITKNKKGAYYGVELNVNLNNPILDSIENICESLKTKNAPVITQHPVSPAAMKISIYDVKLAACFAELAGTRAIDKKFHHSVMVWERSLQREMLGTYANGDGCGTKTGALQFSTASQDLAWQLASLLHRQGIPPSVQCATHKAGTGFNNKETTEYTVSIGKQWAQSLKDVCYKVKTAEIRAVRRDRFFFGHNLATPIRSISYEHVENIPVYNFEVEEDESYVVGGVSAHNCRVKWDICSICGNKAPSRKQYCDHAKFRLGELLPNGKRIFVWNPSPNFFDISIVRRPADKHGFMMKKVAEAIPEIRSSAIMGEYIENASRKIANLNKMSIISKVLQGQVAASKDSSGEVKVLKDFGDRVAKPVADSMQPLSDTTIQELLKYRPAEVFSTLSSMGILLTTPEFVKYFIGKVAPGTVIPEEALDRVVACQQSVFKLLANNPQILDAITDTGFIETSENDINTDLAQKAAALLEKRSQAKDYLYRHLVPDIFKEDTRHRGNWDVINVRDPKTGRTYQTTRLAARQSSDAAGKRQLQNLLGGGAMLAGAAGLSMLPMVGRALAVPAMGAAGYFGGKKLYQGYQGYPSTRADTGEIITGRQTKDWGDTGYAGTELIEKRSECGGHNDRHMMIRLAMDLSHRPKSKYARIDTRWLDTAEGLTFEDATIKLGEVICP